MSVYRAHLRLCVFSVLYYPWFFFGQCLVCVARLLSEVIEIVLPPGVCYGRPSWFRRKGLIQWNFRLCLAESAPSILSVHPVCPSKGITYQENGEALWHYSCVRLAASAEGTDRESHPLEEVKKERNAAGRGGDLETKGFNDAKRKHRWVLSGASVKILP